MTNEIVMKLEQTLTPCVAEIMESMFYLECASSSGPAAVDPGWMYRAVRFAGQVSGAVTIGAHTETCAMLAGNFLGEDPVDVSPDQVTDVFGETANMICGSWLASVFAEDAFTLSSPEEAGFAAEGRAARLASRCFTLEGQPFSVELRSAL